MRTQTNPQNTNGWPAPGTQFKIGWRGIGTTKITIYITETGLFWQNPEETKPRALAFKWGTHHGVEISNSCIFINHETIIDWAKNHKIELAQSEGIIMEPGQITASENEYLQATVQYTENFRVGMEGHRDQTLALLEAWIPNCQPLEELTKTLIHARLRLLECEALTDVKRYSLYKRQKEWRDDAMAELKVIARIAGKTPDFQLRPETISRLL